jgi:hypothetical protein
MTPMDDNREKTKETSALGKQDVLALLAQLRSIFSEIQTGIDQGAFTVCEVWKEIKPQIPTIVQYLMAVQPWGPAAAISIIILGYVLDSECAKRTK